MHVIPLDWLGQGALITPRDPELHQQTVEFCRAQLAKEVNLPDLAKVWVVREGTRILGISGYVLKPDIPVLRAIDGQALRLLAQRMNSYFADQGARGKEAFVYVSRSEKPEQRCPEWNKVISEWGAKGSERIIVEVR